MAFGYRRRLRICLRICLGPLPLQLVALALPLQAACATRADLCLKTERIRHRRGDTPFWEPTPDPPLCTLAHVGTLVANYASSPSLILMCNRISSQHERLAFFSGYLNNIVTLSSHHQGWRDAARRVRGGAGRQTPPGPGLTNTASDPYCYLLATVSERTKPTLQGPAWPGLARRGALDLAWPGGPVAGTAGQPNGRARQGGWAGPWPGYPGGYGAIPAWPKFMIYRAREGEVAAQWDQPGESRPGELGGVRCSMPPSSKVRSFLEPT